MKNAEYEKVYAEMEKKFLNPKQLVWMKKHESCEHKLLNDFSYYKSFDSFEKVPHFYCTECCTRWHDGKEYNPKEWEEYVDG